VQKKIERNERRLRLRNWKGTNGMTGVGRVSDCQQMEQWRRGESGTAEKAIRNDKPRGSGGSRRDSHIDCIEIMV
jgi:hypothetical protein